MASESESASGSGSGSGSGSVKKTGPIAWFTRNHVAANLLMLMLLIGGAVVGLGVRQEVFPDFRLDVIQIQVPYPGASPSEVEQGIVLVVEEAVRGLDGVDRVSAAAAENGGSVYVHIELDAEPQTVLSDVKNAVDRITSMPKDSERPIVALVTNRFDVISLVLYGDKTVDELRGLADTTRNRLLADERITNVDLVGAPAREITVEVPQSQLRAYELTLEEIAGKVAATALELPGGSVKTSGGEILLRTSERRATSREFADIPIVTSGTGTELTLGQIADLRDDFEETDQSAIYDGQPAVMLRVYRTGEQTPIEVADAVREHVVGLEKELPAGVDIATWVDWSEIYRQRMELLLRNAYIGLVLVLLILGMFLELRLAFWVTMGIPVSFLGALMLMPSLDVSVNMISLFAFIVTLGMVVDDAIVVGENIYELRQRGVPGFEAAVKGARQVAIPVTFSIATSIVAFLPMMFVPGFSGKLYRVIPAIVISVLAISLVESLWVLPAHLKGLKEPRETGIYAAVFRQQQKVRRGLETFVKKLYAPLLRVTLEGRYTATAIGIAILCIALGWVAGGHIGFRYMPDIDGDLAIASIEMPYGTPVERTQQVQKRILDAANELLAEENGDEILRGVFAQIGTPLQGDPGAVRRPSPGGHLANVQVFLIPGEERELSTGVFMDKWRAKIGEIPGIESLKFTANVGPSPGDPINIELLNDDMAVLEAASEDLANALRDFEGVIDIENGFEHGKPQLDLTLTADATSLGVTPGSLATQVRSAFYGAEALRQQEGRNEIKVVARLPREQRRSLHDVEELVIRTPTRGEIPLPEAANIERGRSWPQILREDGRRMVAITADVAPGVANPGTVLEALERDVLPKLEQKYPGLDHDFGGAQREQAKSLGSLGRGFQLALIAIFALLAIPFRSYVQPLIVMAAIPFGLVGALIGHIIMGFVLSMISAMGVIALSGVVVNDSLVLIDAANTSRREGKTPFQAIHAAGVRRFRPILLTSLTTFFGLVPMITEQSVQARFLIPMAVSLGFGVLFATFIILLLVPAFYLIVDDIQRVVKRSSSEQPSPSRDADEPIAAPAE